MIEPTVGQRVVTPSPQDFFPDFIVPEGAKGTICHVEKVDGTIYGVAVKFDEYIDGCETVAVKDGKAFTVKNEVYWTQDHFYDPKKPQDFVTEFWRSVNPI
jgi:hypothetical protein